MNRKILKIGLLILIATAIAAFFALDLQQYATLEYIKEQRENFIAFYNANHVLTLSYFGIGYIVITAFSLPGAAMLTLLSGALFGLSVGSLIVCPASTIGATIAFLISRFLLKDSVNNKFPDKIKTINSGVEKEGAFYLFALRLVPVFPFFMINILMGLTPIRTATFFFVSLIGMFPGTMVYVYAGTQLATITSVKDILSLNIIIAFALLGLFPLIAKKTLNLVRKRKTS